tara:strand:- start:103 stop:708 length:606 start_codon:yes stop_codon:yes gene_type:complete
MVSTNPNINIINYKTVILGESSVGKSSISSRFTRDTFYQFQEPTIGASFLKGSIELNNKSITFEIWDTAGQERYHSLAPLYYRNAVFAIVVYDITSLSSFNEAQCWINEIKIKSDTKVIALIGNKVDLETNRQVIKEDIAEYVNDNNLIHLETSAKSGYNINNIFIKLSEKYLSLNLDKSITNKTNSVPLIEIKTPFFGLC